MAFKKIISIFILFLIFLRSSQAKIKHSILATNQSPGKIRFMSDDGKFVYYQKKNGELLLSSDFKIFTVFKKEKDVHYTLYTTPLKKRVLIEKEKSFQKIFNIIKSNNIYITKFGKHETSFISKGNSPEFHLNEDWISFFDSYKKVITFQNLSSNKFTLKIKISNKVNPFFLPEKAMLKDSSVVYTDINNKGIQGLIHYNFSKKKSRIIFKANNIFQRLEICENNKFVYLGVFPLNKEEKESSIYLLKKSDHFKFPPKIIYKSSSNDIGNIECNFNKDFIYFIKNFESEDKKESFEIVKLNLKNTNLIKITDMKFATNIITMDKKLLTIKDGDYYLLEGSNSLTSKEFSDK
ncbi:MAG: hypothetical protein CME68_00145 [Halobacteriovoraceae bacterium]|nr:hypothetical protein [Halobacteriovoraceae bacterium]